ncbi:phosphagen kinase [Desulfoluna spongiiphila]|uniref:Creatine kinase/arginine kinase n=1 Tax=Desulfoluna spongiiphila TaxID=419481 RepID=A0A1G5AT53_9BACT|nr:phosphagen kinase [Desulfoluna spongiiphila]SCX81078.1 creatine kinase/arginine kinase [Desulfoluna spongiiphila]VVS91994.1 atp:guanido phosphotransferase active site [Desulfoluna spongiiphila]
MGNSGFPAFTPECASLLCRHLTPQVWDEVKDLKTGSGYTAADLIRSGVEQQESSVGVYAGDAESYDLFSPLLTPVVWDYHGTSGPHPAPDYSLADLPDLSGSATDKILSTRVRVGRNLAGFPLGPAISPSQRREVEVTIKAALARLPEHLKGTYHALPDMDQAVRDDLIARHLLFKNEDRFLASAGLMRDWPEARGLFLSHDETFSVWVNEEDQLRIISLQEGGDVASVFRRLADGVTALSSRLEFLTHPRLGSLTSCPTNLGTAMRASVHMNLANLAKDEDALHDAAHALGLQVRGVHGEHSEGRGGVYDISNRMRLGVTEAAALAHLINGITRLARMDDEATAP